MSNKHSIFYLQQMSIYKDTLNTFDWTSKMSILRSFIVVEIKDIQNAVT